MDCEGRSAIIVPFGGAARTLMDLMDLPTKSILEKELTYVSSLMLARTTVL